MAKRDLRGSFVLPATDGGSSNILVSCDSCRYDYLLLSKRFYSSPGFHDLDIEIEIVTGGVTIGLLDTSGAWRKSINISKTGRYQLRFGVFWPASLTKVVIAACNMDGPGPVHVVLNRLTIDSWLFRPRLLVSAIRHETEHLAERAKVAYRTVLSPWGFRILICGMAVTGRVAQVLRRLPLVSRLIRGYYLIDTATIGYASRGISSLTTPTGLVLITADVGDDSLSILPVKQGRVHPRAIISCPPRSAPMYVSRIRFQEGDRPVVSLFNFDETGQVFSDTSIGLINDLSAAIDTGTVAPGIGLQPLIQRAGYWGFRGSAVHQLADGRYRLASVDRDRNFFYVLDASTTEEMPQTAQHLDLGPSNEPVGINFAPPPQGSLPINYYLSCRKAPEIIHIQVSPEGVPRIKSRYPVPGLSRSSVAIGRTRCANEQEVLVAQWGGDPTDLNGSGQGSFVALSIGTNGSLGKAHPALAGINPTDIIVGDLDGDGLDEVAVLNYGNGLGRADRTVLGGVDIYKWDGREYARISMIKVPSPRVGLIVDIDGDGRPELAVTTFYEKCLVVIKWLG
jgi:hypothetical protein